MQGSNEIRFIMDTNSSRSNLNPSTLYYHTREDEVIIDLGLSLKTSQFEAYNASKHLSLEEYGELVDWHKENSLLAHFNAEYQKKGPQDHNEEAEGVESKKTWAYVKVNMDGVIVGRKICMLDHGGFPNLALQLEEMFGRLCPTGLRLFQDGSEFCLFYKDKEENWRPVGDVPWKEFIDRVKRLRIARKCEPLLPFSLPFA